MNKQLIFFALIFFTSQTNTMDTAQTTPILPLPQRKSVQKSKRLYVCSCVNRQLSEKHKCLYVCSCKCSDANKNTSIEDKIVKS